MLTFFLCLAALIACAMPAQLRRIILAIGLCILGTVAWAQTSTTVDVSPIIQGIQSPTLWDSIGVLGSGLLAWLLKRLGTLLKIQIDDRIRAYLDGVLHRGIALAQAQTGSLPSQIDVGSPFVATAANYAIARAPAALKWFGIDGDAVKSMVAARTQQLVNTLVPPVVSSAATAQP